MTITRVGFPLISSAGWTGGYNYLYNLLSALGNHQVSRIKPILFCGEDADEKDVAKFSQLADVQIVRSAAFNSARHRASLLRAISLGVDGKVLDALRVNAIDIVFENATFYGWRLPIPTIAWFPDFQHRRLREYFSSMAFFRREMGYRVQIASNRIVMLSSEDSRSDCESFYPHSIGRTSVVRFAYPIDEKLMMENTAEVLRAYNINAPFLYLPNQFWKHKNHKLVIEALGILKQEDCEVLVVSTGNPENFLHPDVYIDLKQQAIEMGLEENMQFLGMVPRSHVISLLRTCSALINPSFFEGWSSTVEEARAFDVPLLLSDIAVHREQMGDSARYFDHSDPVILAQLMREHLQTATSIVRPRYIHTNAVENVARFAHDFAKTIDWALKKDKKN